MHRVGQQGFRQARWIAFATLLGVTFATTTSCSDATFNAALTGTHSAASSLLDTFFSNVAAQNNPTPVTVKGFR